MDTNAEGGEAERPELEGLRALVARAGKGDQSALAEVRQFLANRPVLWAEAGDIGRVAEEALLGMASGDNLLFKESLRRGLAAVKADLAPANPVEKLVVERIGVCWLAANYADALAAEAKDAPSPRAEQLRRRQDSAHKRMLTSLKLLATVRRLLGARGGDARAGAAG